MSGTDKVDGLLEQYLETSSAAADGEEAVFAVPRDATVDDLLRRYVLDGEDVRADLQDVLERHLHDSSLDIPDAAPAAARTSAAALVDVPIERQRSRLDGLSTQAIAPPLRRRQTGPFEPPDLSGEPVAPHAETTSRAPEPARAPAPKRRRRQPTEPRGSVERELRPRVSTGRGSQIPDDDRGELERVRRAGAETADEPETPWVHAAAARVTEADDLNDQLRAYAEHFAAEDERTHAFDADHESTLEGIAPLREDV